MQPRSAAAGQDDSLAIHASKLFVAGRVAAQPAASLARAMTPTKCFCPRGINKALTMVYTLVQAALQSPRACDRNGPAGAAIDGLGCRSLPTDLRRAS